MTKGNGILGFAALGYRGFLHTRGLSSHTKEFVLCNRIFNHSLYYTHDTIFSFGLAYRFNRESFSLYQIWDGDNCSDRFRHMVYFVV